MPESFRRNNVQKDSTSFSLVTDFLADLCTMRMHSQTCWRTNPTKPTVHESLPQRVQCLIWNSGCNVHSRCCVDDVQKGQRLLLSAAAFLQLLKVHVQCDTVTEHVSEWPPVSQLAVASADHVHHTRNASGLQSLHRSPSLLE